MTNDESIRLASHLAADNGQPETAKMIMGEIERARFPARLSQLARIALLLDAALAVPRASVDLADWDGLDWAELLQPWCDSNECTIDATWRKATSSCAEHTVIAIRQGDDRRVATIYAYADERHTK